MLDFKKLKGYPLMHLQERLEGGLIRYQFTHTDDPEIGEEVATLHSPFNWGVPNADIESIEKIEDPKPPHHKVPVKLYTVLIRIRPVHGRAAA